MSEAHIYGGNTIDQNIHTIPVHWAIGLSKTG